MFCRQEGVSINFYKAIQVKVQTSNDEIVDCRTYQLVKLPPKLKEGESLPPERLPSKVYLDTIIEGAKESGLPTEYIKQLQNIPHNKYAGPVRHELD